jgi:hypothetical protein
MTRHGSRPAVGVLAVALAGAACLSVGAAAQEPSPSTAPGLLGATTEVYRDDFSVPTTWTEVDDETGSTAYQEGMLAMSVAAERSTVWDDHQLEDAWPVLRVEAWVAVGGEGAAGVACGSSLGLPRWLWAATDGADGWLVGRIIDTRLQVIDRGTLPMETDGRHVRMGIECASVPGEGGDYAVVTADGIALTTIFDIPVGPYDKATLMVTADTPPVDALFDDLVVTAGSTAIPPSPAASASPAP